ncbi:hypothetical protein RHSIM_Rhsim03G0098100 [Rhododendron simsii]|uniref:Uncharacterized protein n=1 Tax=Rhododendron simsii TaxID=118357 RepID=A0A834H7S6_RHOSS|nr:hypothetical protein RHSIM_Rhsim03G0098100 [Rhododendron simsii]
MDQHDSTEVNDQQLEPKSEMVAIVQHDLMEINDPQPQLEAEPPVSMELIETYEHLKVEIIDLFQMLKSNVHPPNTLHLRFKLFHHFSCCASLTNK